MPMLTIKEVAAALSVSPQWLKCWLVENPVDAEGVPFYIRPRTRRKFEPKDIDRIIAHMRVLEAAKLGLSGQSKARLAGLLSHVGGIDYAGRVQIREEEKRRKEAEKRERRVNRRARLPRAKPPLKVSGDERK